MIGLETQQNDRKALTDLYTVEFSIKRDKSMPGLNEDAEKLLRSHLDTVTGRVKYALIKELDDAFFPILVDTQSDKLCVYRDWHFSAKIEK